MAYDARIILAGQQPDIVNVLARSTQAAGMANQQRQQNALNQLYQTQGANILSGEQGAMNALAGIDPMAAFEMQRSRQTMDLANRQENRLSAADKRAQQVADAERQLRQFGMSTLNAPSPEEYDRLMAENGYPQFVGTYDNRQSVIAGIVDGPLAQIEEWNKAQKAGEPADEYGRYVAEEKAAGRQPLSRIDFAKAKQKNSSIKVGADGSIEIIEGGTAGGPPDMTVEAGKNAGFLLRMQDSNEILNGLEGEGQKFWQQNAENIPFGLGNYTRSPEFQKFDQARRDFVNAVLRRESGAVISPSEFENANQQYFPVPGDSPEVIEQKRRNRENAIAGVRAGAGAGGAYVDEVRQGREQNAAPAKKPMEEMSFEEFSANPRIKEAAQTGRVTVEAMWETLQQNKAKQ